MFSKLCGGCLSKQVVAPSQKTQLCILGVHNCLPAVVVAMDTSCRASSTKTSSFRPRRRPNPNYRPVQKPVIKKKGPLDPYTTDNILDKVITIGENEPQTPAFADLERDYGPLAAQAMKHSESERSSKTYSSNMDLEEQLRMIDYYTAAPGSTEDRAGQRRALALESWDRHDPQEFMQSMDDIIKEEQKNEMELNMESERPDLIEAADKKLRGNELAEEEEEEDDDPMWHHNQVAHGEWGEILVKVNRVIKIWRGGRIESYRSLLVGGNGNGCAGYGFGKAADPLDATRLASRHCKRNVFFLDRYNGSYLTRSLAGKHNSCKVVIFAHDRGLTGNPLMVQILAYFGVAHATCKAYGNRNPYNVVLATFKALSTHESLEDVALKRGKRLMNLDRAQRYQI